MPLRDKPDHASDQQLARYLLGLVTEDEAERLDEASVTDDEVAARLRVVETDLVDAYTSGRLTGDLLKGFESHYLASPRRRENVAFGRSFTRAVNRAAPEEDASAGEPVAVPANAPVEAASGSPMAPRAKVALRLFASAALLVVACGLLLSRTVGPRNGLEPARKDVVASDSRAPERDPRPGGQPAATPGAATERQRLPEPPSAPASGAAQDAHLAALVLLPQTRAAVDRVPTVHVGPGVDRVPVELRLESNDFPRYQVALIDPASNRTVWRSGSVAATSRDRAPTVSVIVPARVLKPQHYSLALVARTGGDANVVGSYTFQVARR